MVAVLFGDKGSTMRCNMNYADSSGFTTMGGGWSLSAQRGARN